MTLVELQSRLCRMSKVLLVFKNVTVRVPSCMCWHVWQLRRDGHLDIPLGAVVASFFICRYSLCVAIISSQSHVTSPFQIVAHIHIINVTTT